MTKKKILFTNGMSNNMILISTNAPKKAVINWICEYNKSLENGDNIYFDNLQKKYNVTILYDSELSLNNDNIKANDYDITYDLNNY